MSACVPGWLRPTALLQAELIVPADAGRLRVASVLLERHGQTYAQQAGIRLADEPGPLFQLLCLALLLSARIRADVAVAACRALADEGWTTPQALSSSSWEARVRVLNHAGYARYDESTARMLGETAALLMDRYGGDVSGIRSEAQHDPHRERTLLQQFPGIGPVGSAIFAREVQVVWHEVVPFADGKALAVAGRLGLGEDVGSLVQLADDPGEFTLLVAALVRCGLARDGDGVLEAAKPVD
jgi:endonuclease III